MALSISLGEFRLVLRFILFSREDLKVFQSIRPWVRDVFCGLFERIESIFRRTAEWSEQKSSKLVVMLCILVMNMLRTVFFYEKWASVLVTAVREFYSCESGLVFFIIFSWDILVLRSHCVF
jgi:hypothetical protein